MNCCCLYIRYCTQGNNTGKYLSKTKESLHSFHQETQLVHTGVAFVVGLPKSLLSNLLAALTVLFNLLAMGGISLIDNKVMLADWLSRQGKVSDWLKY